MDDANKELWRVACEVAGMAPNSGMVAVHSRTVLAVQAERERCMRALEALHWMPRVDGRWDETDVAHAEGFNKAKAEALAALGA